MVTNEEDGGETQLSTRHLPRTSGTVDDSARGTIEKIPIYRAATDAGDGSPHISSWICNVANVDTPRNDDMPGVTLWGPAGTVRDCGDCPQRLASKNCVAVPSPGPLNQQVVAVHLRRSHRG